MTTRSFHNDRMFAGKCAAWYDGARPVQHPPSWVRRRLFWRNRQHLRRSVRLHRGGPVGSTQTAENEGLRPRMSHAEARSWWADVEHLREAAERRQAAERGTSPSRVRSPSRGRAPPRPRRRIACRARPRPRRRSGAAGRRGPGRRAQRPPRRRRSTSAHRGRAARCRSGSRTTPSAIGRGGSCSRRGAAAHSRDSRPDGRPGCASRPARDSRD